MPSTVTDTHQLTVEGLGSVSVSVTQQGEGQPFLVLHGGAGPQSVGPFTDKLAHTGFARVITPTHPGFAGTPRPETVTTVGDLASVYVALLDHLGLADVTVIGNSVGGWIAVEIGLIGSARIARVVLLDATGIDVPDHPVADVSALSLDELMQLSFHNPDAFRIDPSTLPAAARELAAGNRAALAVYGGSTSSDSTLRERLANLGLATLVVWGDSDQIVGPDYGRAYAAAIPGAQFELLTDTGHMPQLESPDKVSDAVTRFTAATPAWTHECSVETTVAAHDIWATLRDLYTGTKLSKQGDTIEIHGPFAVGTTLSVTPYGADFVIGCTIVELLDGETYAYRSEFNGLMITSRHHLTALANGGTRITQHSTIAGPRAESVGPQLGPRITKDHPDAMADLIAAAHQKAIPASARDAVPRPPAQ